MKKLRDIIFRKRKGKAPKPEVALPHEDGAAIIFVCPPEEE
jgi:hypothetical protein